MVKSKKNNLLVNNKNLALLVMLVISLNAGAESVNKSVDNNKQDTVSYSDFIQKMDSTFIVYENKSKSEFDSFKKQKQQEYEKYKKQKQNEYNTYKKQARMLQK